MDHYAGEMEQQFLENLFGYEWELVKSPAGANQWAPKNGTSAGSVPDAHDPSKRHAPGILTTDLALKLDPIYGPIAKRFRENPQEFADAFAKAWYKLTHRDMGPVSRYLGPLVPKETQIWQDPVPAVNHELISEQDVATLKAKILASGLSIPSSWALHGLRHPRSVAPISAAGRTGRVSALRRKRTGK